MRKEVSFAVIIGIILGGAILFGINLANQTTSNLPQKPTPQIITPTPESDNKKTDSISKAPEDITISSVTDNEVLFQNTHVLTGTASKSSPLAIITEEDDLLLKTSPEGTYSATINLVAGENKITLTQVKPDQSQNSKTIILYFSTKPIE